MVSSGRPFVLPVAGRRLFIDIYAKRFVADQPQAIIVAEAKCFANVQGELDELYTAVGQYAVYRSLLRKLGITASLYLAIPTQAYNRLFVPIAMPAIEEIGGKMIVVNLEKEVIEQWLE